MQVFTRISASHRHLSVLLTCARHQRSACLRERLAALEMNARSQGRRYHLRSQTRQCDLLFLLIINIALLLLYLGRPILYDGS